MNSINNTTPPHLSSGGGGANGNVNITASLGIHASSTIALQQQQQKQQQQQPPLPPHSDNVEEELSRIQSALRAVFSPHQNVPQQAAAAAAPPQQQHEWLHQRHWADRYLTSFQGTTVAWMVCDRLLQLGDHEQPHELDGMFGQQCRFFAAQTLHTKCRTDIHQLPPSSLPSLRDSLWQHLRRYTPTNNTTSTATNFSALTTRLALCVSALAVQMGWTTILDDLLSSSSSTLLSTSSLLQANNNNSNNTSTLSTTAADHQQQQQQQQQQLALLILRVLPEECASDRLLLLDDALRFQMRDHLVAKASQVFLFLQDLLHQIPTTTPQGSSFTAGGSSTKVVSSEQQYTHIFEAFHTWIRWVPVQPQSLVETPLLPTCVQALQQSSHVLEPAADVLVEILRMYPSHTYGNEGLVQVMIPLLLTQLPLEQALQSSNEDVWRAYCRVVTELGESYMSVIVSTAQFAQASTLVEWVLKCSGQIRDAEIASITLHFWYRLVMDLESMEPYDYRQELIDAYTPHLLSLMDVCANSLMKFPKDWMMTDDQQPDEDDDRWDDFYRHRFYVSETVEDCCRLLGGHTVLKRMGDLLQRHVQAAQAAAVVKTPDQAMVESWQGMESCLACIIAVHRFVPSDESDVLPFVFQLIPQLPTNIRPLRFTASKTVGKFASWLAMHPDFLQPLLPYLAQGLSIPECAPAAAVAIKELCECSNQSFAIAEPVLQLYQDITAQPGRLALKDELQILEGVCRALSRQTQDRQEDGITLLRRLAQPIGNQLAASVSDPSASPRRILPEIERLTVIIQYLKVPQTPPNHHPLVDLMSSTWSLLDMATNRFPHDNMLAEKICRLHKHALRAVGAKAYAVVLDALIQQLVQSFERTHQSPFLYAASICITEYGPDPAYSKRLYDMVAAMAGTAFSFLRNQEEMTNHPDVVEEFFYLMERFIGHCPEPLITSPLLQSLFQCAAVGMRLDHPGANKGTLKFVETTISYGLSLREQNKPDCQSALERILTSEGQAIVYNLALAIMGDLPMSYNNHSNQIPEILWKLNLLCPGLLAQWLLASFNAANLSSLTDGGASFAVPERAKMDFMGALDTGLARDEFSLAARAFQSACERERRFRKMQRSS